MLAAHAQVPGLPHRGARERQTDRNLVAFVVVVVVAVTKDCKSDLKKEGFIWGHGLRRGTMRHGMVWQQSCGSTDGHITATIRKQRVGRKSSPSGPLPPARRQLLSVPQPFKTAPPARDHVTNTSVYGRRDIT